MYETETDYVAFPIDAGDEFELPTDGTCPLCGLDLRGEKWFHKRCASLVGLDRDVDCRCDCHAVGCAATR